MSYRRPLVIMLLLKLKLVNDILVVRILVIKGLLIIVWFIVI